MSSLSGALLGGTYRVGACLGQGGMGAVYEGVHEALGRRVAIKVLLDQGAISPEALTRFQREATAAAQLGHPNIIQVTDFRSNPGEPPFIVMERLDGEAMEAAIRREGRLAPDRVAHIAKQVLEALVVAHRAGIVHRDIKPANLFLTQIPGVGEVVKVIDFGIAKLQGQGTNLTAAGASMGTPLYAAPELLWGTQSDARADLYSLGATMYHALTGHPPIVADTLPQFLTLVRESFPTPIHQEVPGLHPQLAQVVMFALAKEAGSRYPSAEAMRDALTDVASRSLPPGTARVSSLPTAPTAALQPVAPPGPSYGAPPYQPSAGPPVAMAQTGTPQPYAMSTGGGPSHAAPMYGQSSHGPAAKKSSLGLWVGLGLVGALVLLAGVGLGAYLFVYSGDAKPTAAVPPSATAAAASAAATVPAAGALLPQGPTAEPSSRSVIVNPPATTPRGQPVPAPTATATAAPTTPPAPSTPPAQPKKLLTARCNVSMTNDTYRDTGALKQSMAMRQPQISQCGMSACYNNPITDRHEDDNQYWSANYALQVSTSGAVSSVSPMGSSMCPSLDMCIKQVVFAAPLSPPVKAGPIQVSCYYVRTR